MATIGVEALIILILIGINGYFPLSEIAMVSSRRARLQDRASRNQRGADVALALLDDPQRFLSTVQIGVTLVGILIGALSGAAIARQLAAVLARLPGVAPYSEALGLAVAVAALTYLSLVLGELAPKRIALSRPESIAARVARPMQTLSRLAGPVVGLISTSTDLVVRLVPLRDEDEPPVTDEEIGILVEEGRRAGEFEASERDMVAGALALDDRPVRTVMTPRDEIVWIDQHAPAERIRDGIMASPHGMLPVGRGGLDDLAGIMRGRDWLAQQLRDPEADIEGLLHEPLVVRESATLLAALKELQKAGQSLALVVDGQDRLSGLVTLTDVMAALVGELDEAQSRGLPPATRWPDGSWLLDGGLPTEDVKRFLGLTERLEGQPGESLAALVAARLGQAPAVGQAFEFDGWHLEVVDVHGQRAARVRAEPAKRDER
jgi:putative hemolysin